MTRDHAELLRRLTEEEELITATDLDRDFSPGLLTPRQRIAELVDDGSFLEIGRFARSQQPNAEDNTPADGLITGWARIGGRDVALIVEDPLTLGRSDGQVAENKRNRLLALAIHRRCPVVALIDSGPVGPPVSGPLDGNLFGHLATASLLPAMEALEAPIISAVFGPCRGEGAAIVARADVVISAGTGVDGITIDIRCGTDQQALTAVRDAISLLATPDGPLTAEVTPRPDGSCGPDAAPRLVLNVILDPGTLIEFTGSDRVHTGMARLGGFPILFVATGGGSLDTCGLRAMRRITRVIRRLGLPLLCIQDTTGYDPMNGSDMRAAELVRDIGDDIRSGRAARLSLVVGSGQALGSFVLGGRRLGFDYVAAWPWAEVPVTPGAVLVETGGPWLAAGMGIIDDVLTPEETPPRFAFYLDLLSASRSYTDPYDQRGSRLIADIAKV